MYSIDVRESALKKFKVLERKDKKTLMQVRDKLAEITQNPERYKPLRAPLQNMRAVHIGHFVLIYSVDERAEKITVEEFDHHDRAYK